MALRVAAKCFDASLARAGTSVRVATSADARLLHSLVDGRAPSALTLAASLFERQDRFACEGAVRRPLHAATMRCRLMSTTGSAGASFSEADFTRVADATLAAIESAVSAAEDPLSRACADDDNDDGLDISTSQGVLTLRLGAKGTFVLNKQTPNRQIWWSSPISGPKRYNWDASRGRWVNTRDGHDMLTALHAELLKLTGVDVGVNAAA